MRKSLVILALFFSMGVDASSKRSSPPALDAKQSISGSNGLRLPESETPKYISQNDKGGEILGIKPIDPTPEDLREAKAVPNFTEGKFSGYYLQQVKKGSFFDQLGLKAGDIVQTVSGAPIEDNQKAINR